MMGVSAVWTIFLRFIWTAFPMMTLVKAAVTHFMFVDDLPLVLGIGILQHGTVGG